MPRQTRKPKDKTLWEFEHKDLGEDLARSGTGVLLRKLPTSIALAPDLIAKLKEKGAKRGIGYQTMLKIIVHEHVDEY